jgi:hypothetical protein
MRASRRAARIEAARVPCEPAYVLDWDDLRHTSRSPRLRRRPAQCVFLVVAPLLCAVSCGGIHEVARGGGTGEAGLDAAPTDAGAEATGVPQAAACGVPGQACCAGNACGDGGCCVDSYCVAGGQECGGALGSCSNGSCGSCGGVGQPCCPMANAGGQYQACSRANTPDCSGCTASGAVCPWTRSTDTCIACGEDKQPCCGGHGCLPPLSACVASAADAAAPEDGGASVTTYSCTTQCGHAGEPCCQGNVCLAGGCCLGDGLGVTACVAAPTCGCTNGACTTCGRLDLECCAGGLCDKDTSCIGTPGQCLILL